MRPPRGTALLVSLLVIYLVVLNGLEAFHEKSSQAVFVENGCKIRVLFGKGFPVQGIHQFSDGIGLVSAIKLTIPPGEHLILPTDLHDTPLVDGEWLSLVVKGNEIIDVKVRWMAASQRMACGISLHPDRMSLTDWEALPGIGPRKADKIEEDRQKNGDFGFLDDLRRVQGIGIKSVNNWKRFF
jgi:competence protein ComEA